MALQVAARAIRRVEVIDAPIPAPGPGDVRVRVGRCGICGSDLHWFLGRQALPRVCPGHEASGVVAAVGREIDAWREGDRVTIEPLARCGACERCRRGDYHLCKRVAIYGVTLPGAMATDLVVPAYTVHRLPEEIDFDLGALTEPLAVAVHALRLGGIGGESRVLVLGAGTVGQLAVAAARALGAAFVAATARHPHQRTSALRLGADQVLEPSALEELREKPTIVIETVGGTADTVEQAVRRVERGGTVVIVGLFDETPRFDPMTLIVKEVRLIGSMVYNRGARESDFEIALEILRERAADLRPLVTHVFPLEKAQEAFETATDKRSGAVKVVLAPERGE